MKKLYGLFTHPLAFVPMAAVWALSGYFYGRCIERSACNARVDTVIQHYTKTDTGMRFSGSGKVCVGAECPPDVLADALRPMRTGFLKLYGDETCSDASACGGKWITDENGNEIMSYGIGVTR